MLSRIYVYAASLGLFLAGPAVAVAQSSDAVMRDRASAAAAELPTFELMGFPISSHQVAVLGSANVKEQSAAPRLTFFGMPASPHQIAVLTPHSTVSAETPRLTPGGLAAPRLPDRRD